MSAHCRSVSNSEPHTNGKPPEFERCRSSLPWRIGRNPPKAAVATCSRRPEPDIDSGALTAKSSH